MRTLPHWCCNVCGKLLARVGKQLKKQIDEHRKSCPKTTCSIKQVPQKKV